MVLLYPRGPAAETLRFEPSLRLPDGWRFASALDVAAQDTGGVRFEPVSLVRLIDAPLIAGRHFAQVQVDAGEAPHFLEMAADSDEALALKPAWRDGLARLAAEAGALWGARHYRRYRWQLALSEHIEHFGLEHHESSDNRLGEKTLSDDAGRRRLGGLLSHEYVHSWNGKFRRPADLVTPDYQQPFRTELLWVYEGLTQYLGNLLAARSGLWTPEEAREKLAQLAARFEHRPGRAWRSLADTAAAAQVVFATPPEWASWRREADFYDEMALLWLEVDAILRRESQGQRSLDDFCRAFHGGPEGPYVVKPYTRADVVATLQSLAPYDWSGFFAARVESAGAPLPLLGIQAGGWRLAYDARPNVFIADAEKGDHSVDLTASLGLTVKTGDEHDDEYGLLRDVVPGSPAERAGLGPGMRLVAVNGRRFKAEHLRQAVAATAEGGGGVELLVENGDFIRGHRLDYKGGLRYPHLVRDESLPDTLSTVFAPRLKP
jgi:predicted metalloprotease with PDZ domain